MTSHSCVFILISTLFFLIGPTSQFPSYSQSGDTTTYITLNGTILDETTLRSIPNAHILVTASTIGTSSNEAGDFLLRISKSLSRNFLKISCIGYKTRYIQMPTGSQESLRILLSQDIVTLRSVIVSATNERDIARNLVAHAIENIDKNYSAKQERLLGYFEESLSNDSLFKEPYYLIQAVLEVDKESYSKVENNGRIRLVKGRKFKSDGFDSVTIRIIGGAHSPHRFDFVQRRQPPLNEKFLNDYQYAIIDTLQYDGQAIVVVSFTPINNARGTGNLYISSSTFTVIKGEYCFVGNEFDGIGSNFSYSVGGYKRSLLCFTTEYFYQDSNWRIKHIAYRTEFKSKSDSIYLKNEFTTTGYHPYQEQIPYQERIQYNSVLLNEARQNDSAFWAEHNVVPSTFSKPANRVGLNQSGNSSVDKKYAFLSKFRVSFGVFMYLAKISSLDISMNYPEFHMDEHVESQNYIPYGYKSSIEFELSDAFIVEFESAASFASKEFSQNLLGMSYEINMTPKKRPIYFSCSIKAGEGKQRLCLGTAHPTGEFSINGKTFDSPSIDYFYESRGYFILPGISFSIEQTHRLRYFVSAEFSKYFESKRGVFLMENQFFLKRKNTFIEEGNPNLVVVSKERQSISNGLSLSMGVCLTF